MNTNELLEQLGKLVKPLQDGQERIEKAQQEQGKTIAQIGGVIAQIKSGVEALAAGHRICAKKWQRKLTYKI